MYAIIRAGGKQSKVQSGDVLDIERVKGDATELTFEPLLIVDDDGNALSDHGALAKAAVKAKVLGETQGPKIDIFKYKNKTGYRRRQGHRQKYTRIEITGIEVPGGKKATAKKTQTKSAATKSGAKKAETAKAAAKQTETKETAAKTAKAASEEE